MNKKVIQEFVFYKKSCGEIKNQEEFGLKIGYQSKSSFSQALAKNPLPEELLLKINTVYPEFKQWAVSGSVKVETEIKPDPFSDLSVDDKLNYLFKQNEELREKVRLAHLINRTYLRTIIKHLDIKQDEIKEAEIMEANMKKISSN